LFPIFVLLKKRLQLIIHYIKVKVKNLQPFMKEGVCEIAKKLFVDVAQATKEFIRGFIEIRF